MDAFFPYDARYLRCHPMVFGLVKDQPLNPLAKYGCSASKYKFKCSECETVYESTTNHVPQWCVFVNDT